MRSAKVTALRATISEQIFKIVANHDSPLLHPDAAKTVTDYFPFAGYMHQCCTFMRSDHLRLSHTAPAMAWSHFPGMPAISTISMFSLKEDNNYEMAAFTSALVLIFSIWGARRNGMAIDTTKDMERICQCMETLKDSEPRYVVWFSHSGIVSSANIEGRWAIAGRLWCVGAQLPCVCLMSVD